MLKKFGLIFVLSLVFVGGLLFFYKLGYNKALFLVRQKYLLRISDMNDVEIKNIIGTVLSVYNNNITIKARKVSANILADEPEIRNILVTPETIIYKEVLVFKKLKREKGEKNESFVRGNVKIKGGSPVEKQVIKLDEISKGDTIFVSSENDLRSLREIKAMTISKYPKSPVSQFLKR